MKNLEIAAKIAGLDPEKIDLALLVGGLMTLKQWADKEKHLAALGKESMCEEWRKKGQKKLME